MEILLQVLSLVGAGAILGAYVALADRRVGFVLLEAAWAGVSLASLIRRPSHDRPLSAP